MKAVSRLASPRGRCSCTVPSLSLCGTACDMSKAAFFCATVSTHWPLTLVQVVLEPGDMLEVPAGLQHFAKVVGSEPVEFFDASKTQVPRMD